MAEDIDFKSGGGKVPLHQGLQKGHMMMTW